MNAQEVDEIIACLPRGRTLYHYFKDRYALELLARYVGPGRPVREVRASQFGPLLNRTRVKPALAQAGSGYLTHEALLNQWPDTFGHFRLTLARWPFGTRNDRFYHQTSRRGTNLVLLLNFANVHKEMYRSLCSNISTDAFRNSCHPGAGRRNLPLAWARIDLCFQESAALIEEIQNDWLREAKGIQQWVLSSQGRSRRGNGWARLWGKAVPVTGLLRYIEFLQREYGSTWDEAMLWAAIWFIREELGIRRIYYHTWTSGNTLKRLDDPEYGQPPRSLYTALPRKFCFQTSRDVPQFLLNGRVCRKHRRMMQRGELPMYVLNL